MMKDTKPQDKVVLVWIKPRDDVFHGAMLERRSKHRMLLGQRLAYIDIEIQKVHTVNPMPVGRKAQGKESLGAAEIQYPQWAAELSLKPLRTLTYEHKPVFANTRTPLRKLWISENRLILLRQSGHPRANMRCFSHDCCSLM